MSQPVTLIKLGGSIITNKEIPMELRRDVLTRLVNEIKAVREVRPNELIVVGHGQGSFAHAPAVKYQTMNGFINDESKLGMAIVQDSAAQLNRLVVHAFLSVGIPAVTLAPANSLITNKRKPDSFFTDVFEEYIKQGLFPVTHGDVIVDRGQGCTIWSTEEVLAFFAAEFVKRGWNVSQIIHVVEVDGFYNAEKKVVPEITSKNWPKLQSALSDTKGFDVTGGMGLKVTESLKLAELGIKSRIVSGLKKDNVYNALVGQDWVGTTIS